MCLICPTDAGWPSLSQDVRVGNARSHMWLAFAYQNQDRVFQATVIVVGS